MFLQVTSYIKGCFGLGRHAVVPAVVPNVVPSCILQGASANFELLKVELRRHQKTQAQAERQIKHATDEA